MAADLTPDSTPPAEPAPSEVCDVCGSAALVWRSCKLICLSCHAIVKSCGDL